MEENKYKDVLKGIIKIIRNAEHSDIGFASICTYIGDHCPELESEDERIRRFLHKTFTAQYLANDKLGKWHNEPVTNILAYLEKVKDFDEQLEQAYKNSDEIQYKRGYDDGYIEGMAFAKLELEKQGTIKDSNSIDPHFGKPITTTETKYPKFKIGDWVVDEEDNHVYQVKRVVTNVSSGMSSYDLSDGGYFYSTKTNCHLWSIADAKDGDVLATFLSIFIFKRIYGSKPEAYCAVMDNSFIKECPKGCWTNDQCYPATKEQCQLLFRKMKESGYEWDAEKKELNKIELNPDDLIAEAYQQQAEDLIDIVEEKSTWSEEDKEMKDLIDEISCNNDDVDYETHVRIIRWLNELEQRLS